MTTRPEELVLVRGTCERTRQAGCPRPQTGTGRSVLDGRGGLRVWLCRGPPPACFSMDPAPTTPLPSASTPPARSRLDAWPAQLVAWLGLAVVNAVFIAKLRAR